MEQRLSLITLGVSDLERARTFYREVFAWKLSDMSNENIAFFRLNGILLALFERGALAADAGVKPSGEGFRAFTLAYNTRSEQEVDRLVSLLRQRGARVVKEPEKAPWGGYSGYVADPDGHLWEIAYNPYLPMDAAGNILEE